MSHLLQLRRLPLVFAVILLVLTVTVSISAQGAPPINVDENLTGTLSETVPSISFTLTITEAQAVVVRVFAITPNFAPAVRVLDSNGIELADAANVENATAIESPGVGLGIGVYEIEVTSANGIYGDFLINVAPGEAIDPPQPLARDEVIEGTLTSTDSRGAYAFVGSESEGLLLFVQSLLITSGPNVRLQDAETGETLAVTSSRLRGTRYTIPVGASVYTVELTYGGSIDPQPYRICLTTESTPDACPVETAPDGFPQVVPTTANTLPTETPVPTLAATLLPPLPASNVCILASATGGTINLRAAPGTTFPILTPINANATALVLGRLSDNSWYLVNINGFVGWVSRSVVRFGGPCESVPITAPTPTATTAPLSTATSTSTATPTITLTPTTSPTLNFSLPAVFGSQALTSGFVPDPSTVGLTAGGPANVSYLGSGCTGYTTAAPSFSVNYTSGSFTLLRFYFIGGGDTTMIINSPSQSYSCVDDSFGTNNPTIDFNTPSSGRYDIWIGTYSPGGSIGGTLYVTESSGNRP